jgi:hypothetical protein
LNNQWVTEKINKFLDSNENEDTIYQSLWETAKAVLKEKFIVTSTHIRKLETSQRNNLIMYLKFLEKYEQANTKSCGWKEIIKIRADINEVETKRMIQ